MEERKNPRPELPKEPVLSWAERNLRDFSELSDPEPVIFVTDLALLPLSEGIDGFYFAPDMEVQPDELHPGIAVAAGSAGGRRHRRKVQKIP